MKKTISLNIPCRNEVGNVQKLAYAIIEEFHEHLPEYNYQIQFIDNHSDDGTREVLEKLCMENKNIRAIFNAKNFGATSGFHGFLNTSGDCTINIAADFQEPVNLIHSFVREWENGATIVCAVKQSSKENRILYGFRCLYYKMLKKFSDIDIIEQFSGFGLYDKEFVDFLRNLHDPCPYIRTLVAEFGYNIKTVPYVQQKRKHGKSKSSIFRLYDTAIKSLSNFTSIGLRIASFLGICIAGLCFLLSIVYFVMKILYWQQYQLGMAPLLIGVFFIGGMQLFFIGLLGEYILNINRRIMNRPYVIEEKRLNFDDGGKPSHEY